MTGPKKLLLIVLAFCSWLQMRLTPDAKVQQAIPQRLMLE